MKKASEVMSKVFRSHGVPGKSSTFWGEEKGYSLIEISLVLALIAVLGGGVFLLYNNRVAPATWSSSKYEDTNGRLFYEKAGECCA